MKIIKILLYLFSLVLIASDFAQTSKDVLDYSIPVDAVRGRRTGERKPNITSQNVFAPGTDLSVKVPHTKIAYEEFEGEQLVKRVLFHDGKEHGVQLTWHRNGQLASEEPYRDGIMDGLFRKWDEGGRLVAQYVIRNGIGKEVVYNSVGTLIEEKMFKDGQLEGPSMQYYESFHVRSLVCYKKGDVAGKTYELDEDWTVRTMVWYSDNTVIGAHGPCLRFGQDGSVAEKKWYIRGKIVSEAVYADAAAKDSNLPPYYADPVKYKNLIDAEVQPLIQRYRNMQRVKIPLEFDAQGNPIPAEPVVNNKQ